MALTRSYDDPGAFAGVEVVTTGKFAPNSAGTNALAQVVTVVDQSGVGAAASASSRIPSSAANTNPTVAKASAGSLYTVTGYNASAGVIYLKFYNKATAPTVGTDVPVLTLALPALSAFSFNLNGFPFTTGIAYGMATGAADNSAVAVAAGDVLGLNVTYS